MREAFRSSAGDKPCIVPNGPNGGFEDRLAGKCRVGTKRVDCPLGRNVGGESFAPQALVYYPSNQTKEMPDGI